MGTPDFAVPALKAIHQSAHEVIAVYTQPPRPKGRGHNVQKSPVHEYADANDIPVFTPKSLKTEEAQAEFAALNGDLAIVAAYGLILPSAILDAPKFGCMNIHASLLPRWRGASPIQQAIWKGDAESGVTLMQMDEGLDTGDEIAKRAVAIDDDTTAQSLHDRLADLGGEMVLDVLETMRSKTAIQATPQNNDLSTYAPMLTKDDGKIAWSQPAHEIDRQIRALNPWPGTSTPAFKNTSAAPSDTHSDAQPATIIEKTGKNH